MWFSIFETDSARRIKQDGFVKAACKPARPSWMRACVVLFALGVCACRTRDEAGGGHAAWSERPGYWVWNATAESLGDPQGDSLRWLVAEFPDKGAKSLKFWLSRSELAAMEGVVPVFRLPAGTRVLDDADYRAAVVRQIRQWHGPGGMAALELDYDCPASRLSDYAAWLRGLREDLQVERLSATCLASWIMAPEFGKVCAALDELCPMFYDLEEDDPKDVAAGRIRPLVDEGTIRWVERWRRCPITWRAGLPNFCRLSLFRADGVLTGHLRSWRQEWLVDHSGLERLPGGRDDVRMYRVKVKMRFGDVAMDEASLLVRRHPDQGMLMTAVRAAKEAGASGVIWFAHPASAPIAAYSQRHLSSLQRGVEPRPILKQSVDGNGAIVLSNEGDGDVLASADDRPHRWQVTAEGGRVFVAPAPGDFSAMSPGGVLMEPRMLRSIELFYHQLPAGASLRTAPNALRVAPSPGR